MKVKQFVPQIECLSCDGCCRYSQKQTVWAPLFLFDEIVDLTARNIVPCCLFTHVDSHAGDSARIDLIEADGGQFLCPCFGLNTNKCKIYADRPFDCQLYPFLLAREQDKAYLAVDENCPYIKKTGISTKSMKDHVRYLVEFFSSENIVKVIKGNPKMIQEYPRSVHRLALLPKLTGSI